MYLMLTGILIVYSDAPTANDQELPMGTDTAP